MYIYIFYSIIYYKHKMMLGAKAPNYDAYGLFRAMHSHNPWHHKIADRILGGDLIYEFI